MEQCYCCKSHKQNGEMFNGHFICEDCLNIRHLELVAKGIMNP